VDSALCTFRFDKQPVDAQPRELQSPMYTHNR